MPRRHSNTRRRHEPRGFSAEILNGVTDANDRQQTVSTILPSQTATTIAINVLGLSAYSRDLIRTAAENGFTARELPTAIPLVPEALAAPILAARIAKEKALQQGRIQRRRIESDFSPREVVEDRVRRAIGNATQGVWLRYVELDVVKPTRRTATDDRSKRTVVYVDVDDDLRTDGGGKVVAGLASAARKALELPEAAPQSTQELLIPVVEVDATYAQTTEWFNAHPQQRLPGYVTLANIAIV